MQIEVNTKRLNSYNYCIIQYIDSLQHTVLYCYILLLYSICNIAIAERFSYFDKEIFKQKLSNSKKKWNIYITYQISRCLPMHQKLPANSVQCTMYTEYCSLYTVLCTMCNVHRIFYDVQCTLCNVQYTPKSCMMYNVYCMLYNVQCTPKSCTIYNVRCVMYTVQCTRYAVQ